MTSKRCVTVGLTLLMASCTGAIDAGGPSRTRGPVDIDGDGIPDPITGTGPLGAAGSGANPGGPGGAASNSGGAAGPTVLPSPTLRRLTLKEYQNSVRDLIGIEPDVSGLTPMSPLNGLRAIAASSVALPELDLETFENLADQLTAQVFADAAAREKLTGCDATQTACAEGFVAAFGRRAFRRPLQPEESTRYLGLLRTATQMTMDPWLGLRVVTSAFLQSPGFLYREELGTPDPADPSRRVLGDYELASRLSFFILNTTPDEELLGAAEAGTLAAGDGLQTQAQRLLDSPRAAHATEELFIDYLQLDALRELVKLPEVFPQASDTLGAAMRQETITTLRTLLFERAGDFREVFTTTKTFVDAELAELYDLPRQQTGGTEPVEVELPASGPRAGLLTHAGFLATHAHPGRSSPTRRGKFIRESLLCEAIPAPPPNVNTTLPETGDARTLREKLTRHREDPACSGCHAMMDPIGLALENFDGIGAYRQTENGVPIDASGELDGATFTDARGLGTALAAHPDVTSCFARTLLRYARGALETKSEAAFIAALDGQFTAAGHRMPELMLQIATDPSFRHVGALQ
jgi:hypothetical protein